MKIRVLIVLTVTAVALALSHTPVHAGQGPTKTTWDGVYTTEQAGKGEAIFNDKCSKCHGVGGGGADAPALMGSDFAGDWDGLTVQQLFDRTKTSMPQDAAGSLTREDCAAVITYILSLNRFPAGATELSEKPDVLSSINYVATKP